MHKPAPADAELLLRLYEPHRDPELRRVTPGAPAPRPGHTGARRRRAAAR